MCGIAGFVGDGDQGDLERMTRCLAHRGPDAEGYHIDEPGRVHLGHRRLSIIDLAGGTQPMFLADGDCVIVFNGEIYNHMELRAQLEDVGMRVSKRPLRHGGAVAWVSCLGRRCRPFAQWHVGFRALGCREEATLLEP